VSASTAASSSRPLAACGGRERCEAEREPGEILHDAIVQVGGDPLALHVRSVDGVRHERGALLRPAPHALRERPRQRYLQHHEQDESTDERRGEAFEELVAVIGDGAEALVGFEEQRRAVRSVDACVRLHQAAFAALEAVLRLAEIADLDVGAALLDRLAFLRSEREALAHQLSGIGVVDRAVAAPDLHADE
jgi:hypothetical protein